MIYTTQGLMSPADIADHEALTDTGRNPECPGHDDPDNRLGLLYCTRAEDCPHEGEDSWMDEDAEPEALRDSDGFCNGQDCTHRAGGQRP